MKYALVMAVLAGVLSASEAGLPSSESRSADLARYYFSSASAEVAARVDLNAAFRTLDAYHGHINSGPQLLNSLQSYEEVLRVFNKHESYLHLRCSRNRKDLACQDDGKLESEFEARTAFLDPEILAIPSSRLNAFLAAEPRLKVYAFALEDIRRNAPHTLPGPQQAFLDSLNPEIAGWQYDLYDQVVSGIPFGTVQTSAGPRDVIRQRTLLASDPDPHVREEAFHKRFQGYASQRDLLAFALLHTVKARTALAKAHGYEDAPAEKYQSMYLEPQLTRSLLQSMADHGVVARRFEEISKYDFERAYHTETHAWDLLAPEPGLILPRSSMAELPTLFHKVFAGLGTGYQSAFDALLAPENGRVDLIADGAPDRYTGGFSTGFDGDPSILFYGRFDGTFKDLSVIAHEGGHATHRTLMGMNGVKPVYASGPSFLFESFAEFNELILADYLAETTTDPRLQRFYRKQWLGIKGLDAFYGAQDALLEQTIYDGVSAGNIHVADDLDKISVQVDKKFSEFPATTPELRNRWMMVSLMYEDPLYDVNYVYGGLLALKYYRLYTEDRERFVPNYVALLKNGMNAPPTVLLKKFLGIDLYDPLLLTDDIKLLNSRMDILEKREVY